MVSSHWLDRTGRSSRQTIASELAKHRDVPHTEWIRANSGSTIGASSLDLSKERRSPSRAFARPKKGPAPLPKAWAFAFSLQNKTPVRGLARTGAWVESKSLTKWALPGGRRERRTKS